MKKGKQVFWGIFWILAAVMLIAWQFIPLASMSLYGVIACVLLLAGFVQGIINRNICGIVLPVAALYAILQYSLPFLPFISPWILLGASILICIGLSIIFKKTPTVYVYPYQNNCGQPPNVQHNPNDHNIERY